MQLLKDKEIRKRLIWFLGGVLLLVTADLVIKHQVETHWVREWSPDTVLGSDEVVRVFPSDQGVGRLVVKETTVIEDFWSFTYVRNYNIGFSLLLFLENYFSHEAVVLFLKWLQLGGVILLFIYFLSQRLEPFLPALLVIGGGLGNVIDRWQRGYVVDYVKWYLKDSPIALLNPWPIFNLADAMITLGVLSLLLLIFFHDEKKETPADKETRNNP